MVAFVYYRTCLIGSQDRASVIEIPGGRQIRRVKTGLRHGVAEIAESCMPLPRSGNTAAE